MKRQDMVDWFFSVNWSHAATINLEPQSNPKAVCRMFLRNFNRAIFGRSRAKFMKLTVLPVYADDKKINHIHFAFGGFPFMPEQDIKQAFTKAVKATPRIRAEKVWKNGAKPYPLSHITYNPTSRLWLDYILRFTENSHDRKLLLDLSNFGRAEHK